MEIVDRQLTAYNAHDLAAFIACFSSDVLVLDGSGSVLAHGHNQMRERYGPRFAQCPDLRAEIEYRSIGPPYVTDIERITGWQPEPVWATAIYRVAGDAIDRVVLAISTASGGVLMGG